MITVTQEVNVINITVTQSGLSLTLQPVLNVGTGLTKHGQLNLDDGTNPHGTTKVDVGLSDADNTSDADKPISTAQSAINAYKVNSKLTGEPTGSYQMPNVVGISQADYDQAVIDGTTVPTTTYFIPE